MVFKKGNNKNSLLQSKQEQRSKHKIHWVVLKTQSHNHKEDDEVVEGGGDETLQAFLKSEFTLQITFTLYIYLYTYRKDIPRRK